MIRLSPVFRVTLGLVLMTASILLVGDLIGLIPNDRQATLDARKKLCESLAIQLSLLAQKDEVATMAGAIQALVERNEDVLSAGLRKADGTLLVEAGAHRTQWHRGDDTRSTPTHVQVPIFSNQSRWANVEVVFVPLGGESLSQLAGSPLFRIILFVTVAGFVGYFLFMKKVLRELDPQKVIPARVQATLDALAEGVLIMDEDEQVVLANATFASKVGVAGSQLVGQKISRMRWEDPHTGVAPEDFPWLRVMREEVHRVGIPLALRTGANQAVTFMVNASPILDGNKKIRGAMATFDDVSQLEAKNAELGQALKLLRASRDEVEQNNQKLEKLAMEDPLSGCLNRRAFFARAEDLFAEARQADGEISCIMADIDHFKRVNDTYGHAQGDAVIKRVAKAIRTSLRENDLVARYGGEEFCVMLPGVAIENAQRLADRIRQVVAESDAEIRVTSSFGVASIRDGAHSPTELLNQADEALYVSKQRGRNCVTYWKMKDTYDLETSAADPASVVAEDGQERLTEKVGDQAAGRTSISNRMALFERINEGIAEMREAHLLGAVLVLGLGRFRRINDVLGHQAGDQLLEEISNRLIRLVRRTDSVMRLAGDEIASNVLRLSGDEFGIVLTGVYTERDIEIVVQRVIETVTNPVYVEGQDLYVTARVGVSLFPTHGEVPDELFKKAGMALTKAKHQEMNGFRIYTQDIDSTALEELRLETRLHSAVALDELVLHYQPKYHLTDGVITGMEALVRWEHPEVGLLYPNVFIPVAEASGTIIEIGGWVFLQACKQALEWKYRGQADLRVAVNLSALQLMHETVIEQFDSILQHTGVDPTLLELEITETAVMDNLKTAVPILTALQSKGMQITIDDFGAGHSSLNYLKHLPIDKLKIDRSFVRDMDNDSDDRAIVSSVIEMAHLLGLTVVAEGVETEAQLGLLQTLRCDEVQGFLFSRPVAEPEATDLLCSGAGLEMVVPAASEAPVRTVAGSGSAYLQGVAPDR